MTSALSSDSFEFRIVSQLSSASAPAVPFPASNARDIRHAISVRETKSEAQKGRLDSLRRGAQDHIRTMITSQLRLTMRWSQQPPTRQLGPGLGQAPSRRLLDRARSAQRLALQPSCRSLLSELPGRRLPVAVAQLCR